MTDLTLALWSFPVLLVLVFLRVPIALAMMAVGVAGSYLVDRHVATMVLNPVQER